MSTIWQGSTQWLWVRWTDAQTGEPVTATGVTLRWRVAGGAVQSAVVQGQGDGVWRAAIETAAAGLYEWEWACTGPAAAVEVGEFRVIARPLPP